MTHLNDTLDPIRPDDGTVGDNIPSGVVEVVQAQEEIIGNDGIEDAGKGGRRINEETETCSQTIYPDEGRSVRA